MKVKHSVGYFLSGQLIELTGQELKLNESRILPIIYNGNPTMKFILFTLALILGHNFIAQSQNPFYDQIDYTRVTCNFNGSVSNGKEILVYGDGGVILRSAEVNSINFMVGFPL